jgi:hypothetical protein
MKVLTLVLVGLTTTSAAGVAQSSASIGWTPVVGTRARILSPALGGERQVGTIEAVAGDTLQFRRTASPNAQWLKTAEITTVDVSSGTHTERAKWAAIGMLVGAATGAAIGAATFSPPPPCTDSFSCAIVTGIYSGTGRQGSMIGGGIIGAVSGALFGTLFGNRQRETWTAASR